MTQQPTITIDSTDVSFSDGFKALDDVSLTVPSGRITGLIGPSGAGKTTLMRSIVGRQKLAGGTITILGHEAGSAELRQIMSYKTQEIAAYDDLTVSQNLTYFAQMMNVPKSVIKKQVSDIIETVRLDGQRDQLVESLSGGQKQRASLAISMIGDPEVLILDEPTVGLDPLLREELWDLFRTLAKEGKTLLVSSHVMDEAEKCDELVLIRDGKVVAQDSPRNMKHITKSKTVEESFLKYAKGEVV